MATAGTVKSASLGLLSEAEGIWIKNDQWIAGIWIEPLDAIEGSDFNSILFFSITSVDNLMFFDHSIS